MFQEAVIRAGATISSTAVAPASTSWGTGSTAEAMSGKWTQARVVRAGRGTVSNSTREMNPRVPSEPTRSRLMIPSGVSESRKAQSRYPIVFLISNLRRISSVSSGSARISSRISSSPSAIPGSAAAKASSAPGAVESTTVPEGRTKVIPVTVE